MPEIRIVANADVSLIEDANGALANSKAAAGNFVGMTNNMETRRMLLAFDLGIIPADVRVDSVTLEMHMSRTSGDESDVGLHRFRTDWTEGRSQSSGQGGQGASSAVGDPTWIHASFDQVFWETPGGDYVTEASAATLVGSPGDYQWESERLTSDVESWLADPATNFGWIVIGDESRTKTAKRFDSRENEDETRRPTLVIGLAP